MVKKFEFLRPRLEDPNFGTPKFCQIFTFSSYLSRMAVRYDTFKFAYYVPRTLNRTVPAYRTSVQFLKRTVPTYRTRTVTKKAYRTNVPYFFAKIEAYCTVLTYRAVLPSLLLTNRNFN